jgi:gliding motility-associated-like protein
MPRHFLLLFLFLVKLVFIPVNAQVSSITADFKIATAYSSHDSIFIFNQSPTVKKGSLQVTTPGSAPTSFEWSAYDSTSHTFLPVFKTDANVAVSSVSELNSGGYRIHAFRTGWDTTIVSWVFLNDFTYSVEKNNAGEVLFYRRTCEFINLQATAIPSLFKYFDSSTSTRYTLKNSVLFTWSASPANGVTLGEGAKLWIEDDELPNEDTEYTGRGTDNFGLSKEDKVKYISIIPKADFEVTYPKKYESAEGTGDGVVSAPLTVTFKNNSKNAVNYTWVFGDGDTIYLKEPENTPDPHIYTQSDKEYHLKLIAESKEGCSREDTVSIKIDKSELDAPNFFSPNGDGDNDKFVIRNVSLREFHLTIYSPSGRKVYEFHGPDINSWEGWTGEMGGNGSKLSTGIYYYVVEAISWEQPANKYRPTKYSSFVYLFRE